MAIRFCNSGTDQHKRQENAFRVKLMGFCKSWYYIILVMFSLSLSSFARGSNDYDLDSLNAFIHDYANKSLGNPRTGILYNIFLPANFSGMEVSAIRLRSGQFWATGRKKISLFQFPPKIRPTPYAKRIAILCQNFGNWSSYYYNVPGYRLVAPVVGFVAYDSSNSSTLGNLKVNFSVMGNPISVHFSHDIVLGGKDLTPKCVKFGADGSFTLQDMNESYVCVSRSAGHFSVVVPKKHDQRILKFWVLGFGLGFVVLVLGGLVLAAIFRLLRRRKIMKMEQQTERGVAFDTFWIGGSKLPSASMIRTQPALENEYVP